MSALSRLSAVLSLFTLAPAGFAQTALKPMTLVDVMNVPQVSDPQVSSNGREILYVLSQPNWKANKRIGHIWKVNSDGSGAMQMTSGTDGENSPRWSPDGKTIAFIAKRGTEPDAAAQILLISDAGGEAQALTTHSTAVQNITWSPDGAMIYFRAADAKSDEQKARDKVKDDVFLFDENFEQQHLWNVNVATKAEHRLTQGDFSVLAYNLSNDGTRIVLHRAPTPLIEDSDKSEVWLMDSSGSGLKQITRNHVQESDATLSPDNSQVLFLSQADQKFETYYNRKVFIAPASGGDAKVLMPQLPYEVDKASWSKDGKAIFFLANMGVHTELFKVAVMNPQPEQLTTGKHTLNGWTMSTAANEHIYTSSEMSSPGEVWISSVDGGSAPKKVTSVYEYLAKTFKLPRQERVEWKGADGTTVEGLLYYPLDYQEGKRYPLAVQTHGGPQASDKYGFGGAQNFVPVLAAKGYAVLQPNYRGSTGYGDEFLRDMVGHYFQNAHLDVMTGVDALIARGIVDPDRMVKMGWSGGGHMTNKIITITDRFKAASSGAGAANWVSMYAQSDVRTYRTPWFGGTPWQKNAPIDAYWNNSPLKDIANVKTPTIFLVGQNDVRVPSPQSVEMYRALKSNGVPTHLYIAPREPHGWAELRHVLYKMNVELAWFEKYAMNREYAWEKAPVTP
jgi:dipeptidyl aminopeptidase/acylaminoacyl peptidase